MSIDFEIGEEKKEEKTKPPIKKEEKTKPPIKKKENLQESVKKEKCPYCNKEYASLSQHLSKCPELKKKIDSIAFLEKENKDFVKKIGFLESEKGILENKLRDLEKSEDWIEFENITVEKQKIEGLIKLIDTLDSSNIQLIELYEKKKIDWKTKEKLFELDYNKIRKYIVNNFENIPNWEQIKKKEVKIKSSEYPSLQATINRVYSGRTSYLEDYVELINMNPNSCIRDEFTPQRIDSVTLEVIKEFLIKELNVF